MKQQSWWKLPPGKERERLKAETTPKPKPPRWRHVKGPKWIKHGTSWVETNYRRVEYGAEDPAAKLWAHAQAICPLLAPAAAIPRVSQLGNLVIDYLDQSYLIPVFTPSDIAFAIKQMRYHDLQLENQ